MYICINPKPLNPPYTPFWGVLLSALRGKYIFEKCTQKQIDHLLYKSAICSSRSKGERLLSHAEYLLHFIYFAIPQCANTEQAPQIV